MSHQVKSTPNLIYPQGARPQTRRNLNLGKAGNTPETKENLIKIEFTTNKTSRNGSRKESGATAPAKSLTL